MLVLAFSFASFISMLAGAFHMPHLDLTIPVDPMFRHATPAATIPVDPMAHVSPVHRMATIPVDPM